MHAETLAYAFGAQNKILLSNLNGICHDESLLAPGPTANGINWLAGHVLNARGRIAKLTGAGGPFLTAEESAYYGKGSHNVRAGDPCAQLERLVAGLVESGTQIRARLAAMTDAELDAAVDVRLFPIPPDQPTLGALITFLVIHEAYHNGQIGIVRRAIGKPSGIGA